MQNLKPMEYITLARKAFCLFLAGAFLFTNTLSWAKEEDLFSAVTENKVSSSGSGDRDSLAATLRSTLEWFKEKFLAGEILLSHKYVNAHIENAFLKGLAKRDGATIDIRGSKFYKDGILEFDEIEIVAIPELLAKTGLFAHVGLGRAIGKIEGERYSKPTVYIDSKFYYDEGVRQHEIDEIVQWELLRAHLGLRPHQMRQWILDHFEVPDESLKDSEYEKLAPELTSVALAKKFHKRSHRLSWQFYKQNAEGVDFAAMLALYDEAREEKDVVISANAGKVTGKDRIKIAIIVPRSLETGYGKVLSEGFREFDSPDAAVELLAPRQGESVSAFSGRVREGHYDFAIVNLHGAHNEEPVAFNNFGCKTVILVHRSGEAIKRLEKGLYKQEDWDRAFGGAAATVLLGEAGVSDYRKFCARVTAIPHGFSGISASPIVDKHFAEGVVIGSSTIWSEMRSMRDVIALVKEARKHPGGGKIFGYIAGLFIPYKHPDTGQIVNEAEMLKTSPDCVFLSAGEVKDAYKKEGGFNDLASFKKWLFEKSEKGERVIIVEGDLRDNREVAALEASLIDFSAEMYHEIMDGFRPKDEYPGALHRNPGSKIAVGFDSGSMRDLAGEGIGVINVEYRPDGSIDFTQAAQKIIGYIESPDSYYARLRESWIKAKGLTARNIAERYLGLAQDIVSKQGEDEIARRGRKFAGIFFKAMPGNAAVFESPDSSDVEYNAGVSLLTEDVANAITTFYSAQRLSGTAATGGVQKNAIIQAVAVGIKFGEPHFKLDPDLTVERLAEILNVKDVLGALMDFAEAVYYYRIRPSFAGADTAKKDLAETIYEREKPKAGEFISEDRLEKMLAVLAIPSTESYGNKQIQAKIDEAIECLAYARNPGLIGRLTGEYRHLAAKEVDETAQWYAAVNKGEPTDRMREDIARSDHALKSHLSYVLAKTRNEEALKAVAEFTGRDMEIGWDRELLKILMRNPHPVVTMLFIRLINHIAPSEYSLAAREIRKRKAVAAIPVLRQKLREIEKLNLGGRPITVKYEAMPGILDKEVRLLRDTIDELVLVSEGRKPLWSLEYASVDEAVSIGYSALMKNESVPEGDRELIMSGLKTFFNRLEEEDREYMVFRVLNFLSAATGLDAGRIAKTLDFICDIYSGRRAQGRGDFYSEYLLPDNLLYVISALSTVSPLQDEYCARIDSTKDLMSALMEGFTGDNLEEPRSEEHYYDGITTLLDSAPSPEEYTQIVEESKSLISAKFYPNEFIRYMVPVALKLQHSGRLNIGFKEALHIAALRYIKLRRDGEDLKIEGYYSSVGDKFINKPVICKRIAIMALVKSGAIKKGKGSPADCLETIKTSPVRLPDRNKKTLFELARDKNEGITAAEVAAQRDEFGRRTIDREFDILKDIGILVPVVRYGKIERGYYRFSDMMIGLEPDDTKTFINAICGIRYQVGKKGKEMPLVRGDIPKDQRGVVKELVRAAVLDEMNKTIQPVIAKGRVLWHLLEESVVSDSQRGSFAQMLNNASKESRSPERIWILRRGESIGQAVSRIKKECPNAVFDVALSSINHIKRVPVLKGEDRIKMLVFKGRAGDFRQVGGVIAALRALHLPKDDVVPALLRIYLAMKGNAYQGKIPPPSAIDDPREFARTFIFDLPPITSIPVNDIPKMNKQLLKLLTAA